MQINNNVNSMIQLEKNLDKSASTIASNTPLSNINEKENIVNNDFDLAKEMVKQIEIPIAYTANAEVISTQNAMYDTLLDIKA